MKLKSKLKLLVASLVIGVAASASAAPINIGGGGNGDLFFNAWDATGSYTRNLNLNIDSFEGGVALPGLFAQTWAADTTFSGWIGSHSGFEWNIVALDASGARRFLNTAPLGQALTPTSSANNIRSAVANIGTYLANNVNPSLTSVDSATFTSADPGYYGAFPGPGNNSFGLINFNNTGVSSNSSYASGLDFLKLNAPPTGAGTVSTLNYVRYADGTDTIRAWVDGSNTLHLEAVAAVPEPETYGMLAAGLLMLGAVARRRRV
jgi:hypothetical protein